MAAPGGTWRRLRGRSAQAEVDRLGGSSEWLFDLPSPRKSAVGTLALSLLLGLYFVPFTPGRWFVDWPLYSLVFFTAPAILSAVFSFGWLRLIGAKTYLYRTFLLSLVNLAIIGVILLPGKAVEVYYGLPRAAVLLFAYSVLALINNLVFLMTATRRWVLALPATLAQPLAGYVPILFAYFWSGGEFFMAWELPALAIIYLVTFLAAGRLALYIGTRPIHLTYGIDGIGIFRAFLDHWVEGGEAGRKEIEDFFQIFAEPVDVHLGVVHLRERGTKRPIATLVTPSVHPGPWGRIGASDLPERMAKAIGPSGGEVMTLHGASDHDLDPASQDEVAKIIRAAEGAFGQIGSYSSKASPFLREPGDFDACAQAFNGAVVAVHTSAPEPTDDVDGPSGYVIERHLEEAGASPGIFVDAHNCLTPGAGGVSFGSPKARALAKRLSEVGARALAEQRDGLRAGAGRVPPTRGSKGMGAMGVQSLIVEVGGKRMAWVLIDGNNVMCGLREAARERLLRLVDEAEVLTTDSHVVNVMVGGFNPVGLTEPQDRVIEMMVHSVEDALGRMQDAEVGAVRVEAGDVHVFGHGNTIRLSSAINSSVATAEGALAASFALATAISIFATYVLGYAL
jgi:putative membrane protein